MISLFKINESLTKVDIIKSWEITTNKFLRLVKGIDNGIKVYMLFMITDGKRENKGTYTEKEYPGYAERMAMLNGEKIYKNEKVGITNIEKQNIGNKEVKPNVDIISYNRHE